MCPKNWRQSNLQKDTAPASASGTGGGPVPACPPAGPATRRARRGGQLGQCPARPPSWRRRVFAAASLLFVVVLVVVVVAAAGGGDDDGGQRFPLAAPAADRRTARTGETRAVLSAAPGGRRMRGAWPFRCLRETVLGRVGSNAMMRTIWEAVSGMYVAYY